MILQTSNQKKKKRHLKHFSVSALLGTPQLIFKLTMLARQEIYSIKITIDNNSALHSD